MKSELHCTGTLLEAVLVSLGHPEAADPVHASHSMLHSINRDGRFQVTVQVMQKPGQHEPGRASIICSLRGEHLQGIRK